MDKVNLNKREDLGRALTWAEADYNWSTIANYLTAIGITAESAAQLANRAIMLTTESPLQGIATPSGNPEVYPGVKASFIATASGYYENYGGFTVEDNEFAVFLWDGSLWIDAIIALTDSLVNKDDFEAYKNDAAIRYTNVIDFKRFAQSVQDIEDNLILESVGTRYIALSGVGGYSNKVLENVDGTVIGITETDFKVDTIYLNKSDKTFWSLSGETLVQNTYEVIGEGDHILSDNEVDDRIGEKTFKAIVIEDMYVFEDIDEGVEEMNSYIDPYGGFDIVRNLLVSGKGFMQVNSDGYRITQVYFQDQGEDEFTVVFLGSDDGTIPAIHVSMNFNKFTGWKIRNKYIATGSEIENFRKIYRINEIPWELNKTKQEMDNLLAPYGGFDIVQNDLKYGKAFLACGGNFAVQTHDGGTGVFSALFLGADDGVFDVNELVYVIFSKNTGITVYGTYRVLQEGDVENYSPVVLDLPIFENVEREDTPIDPTELATQYAKYGGFANMLEKIRKDNLFYVTGIPGGDTSDFKMRTTPINFFITEDSIFAIFIGSDDSAAAGYFLVQLYENNGISAYQGWLSVSYVESNYRLSLTDGLTLDPATMGLVLDALGVSGVDSLAFFAETQQLVLRIDGCFPTQLEHTTGKLTIYYSAFKNGEQSTFAVVFEENVGITVTLVF